MASRITSGPTPSPARRTILRAIAAAMRRTRLKVCPIASGKSKPRRVPRHRGRLSHRFGLELLLQFRDEPARFEDLEHVRRQRGKFQHRTGRHPNLTTGEVELDHVARLHTVPQTRALDHGESEVDRVPEEDTRERGREDRGDAQRLQCDRRLLPARAAAEVDSRDDHVPGLDFLRPCRVDGLEGVLREHLRIRGPQVLACDDMVRRDVVAERPHAALKSSAAIRRSSMRALVHEPRNATSIFVPSTSSTGLRFAGFDGHATCGPMPSTSKVNVFTNVASSSDRIGSNRAPVWARYSFVTGSASIMPTFAPISVVMLHRTKRSFIGKAFTVEPVNSTAAYRAASSPVVPITLRMTSLAPVRSPRVPRMSTRIVSGTRSHNCPFAITAAVSVAPIPAANAPTAPTMFV